MYKFIEDIRRDIGILGESISDNDAREFIEMKVLKKPEYMNYSMKEVESIVDRIFFSIRRDLSILQPLIEDKSISEIMVNGPKDIFIEKKGEIYKTNIEFASKTELEEVIRRIASKVQREINEVSPIVDARLEDGSRVNGVYDNIALGGPILTIRKFAESHITMEQLVENSSITRDCVEFLQELVVCGFNIFISGGTSSGKTTFLNALADFIPKKERVILIEDSAELQIKGIENIVRLECKEANSQGKGEIPMASLIKTSLRMRPSRIIVGEVREGKSLVQMLQAMNTGHDGSLSTGHGNSVKGMIRRLESLYLQEIEFPMKAVQNQICEAIDIMIHLGRRKDGSRVVLEVSELAYTKDGEICTNRIFEYSGKDGLINTGSKLINREKLSRM